MSTDRRILSSAIGAALVTHPTTAGLPAADLDELRDEIAAHVERWSDPSPDGDL